MWIAAPDAIVELGAQSGASTLWLRDRLRTLHGYGALATDAPPRVVAVDIDLDAARHNVALRDPAWADSISFVEGDVCDPSVREAVGVCIPRGAVCMVIEDSAHTAETTRAALELYSDLIAPGGFFVVEDGCVDVPWMRVKPDWPEGVLPALNAWLATPQGSAFRIRRDLEVYGVSCHPSGFLQRIA
jgi:cephalosporin hydroxylase